jgi:hypothetical protein
MTIDKEKDILGIRCWRSAYEFEIRDLMSSGHRLWQQLLLFSCAISFHIMVATAPRISSRTSLGLFSSLSESVSRLQSGLFISTQSFPAFLT